MFFRKDLKSMSVLCIDCIITGNKQSKIQKKQKNKNGKTGTKTQAILTNVSRNFFLINKDKRQKENESMKTNKHIIAIRIEEW